MCSLAAFSLAFCILPEEKAINFDLRAKGRKEDRAFEFLIHMRTGLLVAVGFTNKIERAFSAYSWLKTGWRGIDS